MPKLSISRMGDASATNQYKESEELDHQRTRTKS